MTTLQTYVLRRIKTLQNKHGFVVSLGGRQVQDRPELQQAYGRFAEVVAIAKKMGWVIPDPTSKMEKEDSIDWVYFFQVQGTSTWKIGHSKQPHLRRKNIQVAGTLVCRKKIPGGYELEQKLLKYLAPRKIPGSHKEWFYLNREILRDLIRRLKADEPLKGVYPGPRKT